MSKLLRSVPLGLFLAPPGVSMPDIRVQLTLGRVERPIGIELVLQMSEHLFDRGVVQAVPPATYFLAPFPVGRVRVPHGRELGRLAVWMGCF